MSIFTIIIFIFSFSSIYSYNVEYKYICDVNFDPRPFLMNNSGTIVYKNYDENDILQIYVYKNGKTKQITSFQSSYTVVLNEFFCLNENDQIVWVQSEYSENDFFNDVVMFADLNKNEIKPISNLLSEKFNTCFLPTINDNGDVAWMQKGYYDSETKLFVYKDESVNEIFSSKNEISSPHINNNGYVVYLLSEFPDTHIYRLYLWDGKQNIRIDNTSGSNVCYRPNIDNKNNILYITIEHNKKYFMFYSNKTGKTSKIDIEVDRGESLSSFNDAILDNGTVIFTGKDLNIYLYKDEKLEKLTSKFKNYNPTLKNEYMGWIFIDSITNSRKILFKTPGKDIIIDAECDWGLMITYDAQFLFTRFFYENGPVVKLFYGKINFEASQDTKDNNLIKITPNPAFDYINVSIDINKNIQNSDIVIRDVTGRIVQEIPKSSNLTIGSHSFHVNTNDLPNGVYFIEINDGSSITGEKIIIER